MAQQQKGLQAVTARLEEQAVQIQKVSAQLAAASPSHGGLEVNRPARKWLRTIGDRFTEAREILGNHRGQSQHSRLQFGL